MLPSEHLNVAEIAVLSQSLSYKYSSTVSKLPVSTSITFPVLNVGNDVKFVSSL